MFGFALTFLAGVKRVKFASDRL